MSSLDMVAYINATREAGKAELQHKHFLAKVPSVIGYSLSAEFLAHKNIAFGSNGQTRQSPVYNFPRREAMLMAMSYSYKLQATVYDAWQAAEANHRENFPSRQYTLEIPRRCELDRTRASPQPDHSRVGTSLACPALDAS